MSDDSMGESRLRAAVTNSEVSPGDEHRLVLEPTRPRLIRIQARGEEFPILQIQGQLFVCSKANGNCCCGWEEKGRAPVNASLYEAEWERRGLRSRLHLSFTGCLGVCTLGNNALLQILGRSIWLKDLNDDAFIPAIFDYAEAMLQVGQIVPPSPSLKEHVYERFLAPPTGQHLPLIADAVPVTDDLQYVDPVCFMNVDPATARHVAEFQGRTIYFCAPSCKRQFLANPAAFNVG
ncbi:MAG: cobaltochelatase, CobN subunit [Chloroflexi bacterium]|nr:cobaltochelatase, CobN subunit [Chloroflexota bacterium]